MAIVFTKEKKKHNVLIVVFIFLIVIIAFIFWQGFSRKTITVFLEKLPEPPKEIKINFEVLRKIREFQPFAEIEPFKIIPPTEDDPVGREAGRENPFLPY